MKFMATVAFMAWLFLGAGAGAAEKFKLGENYQELPAPYTRLNPADDRIEVTLLFWYGCGACGLVDPVFTKWAETAPEDVRAASLPVTWAEPWNMHARLFMALDVLGREKELHAQIFQLFRSRQGMARDEKDLPALAEKLGLDPAAFMETYHSKEVDRRMEELDQIMKIYDTPAVPAIVVDGRYLADLGQVEEPSQLIELAEFLADKIRAAKK